MTTSTRIALASFAVGLGGLGYLCTAPEPAHADAAVTVTTLRLTAHPRSLSQLDTGKRGPTVGDQVFEKGRLTGDAKGSYLMSATLVGGPANRPSESQHLTLELPGGSLELLGQHLASDRYALAVVGGTGSFAGASGSASFQGGAHKTAVVVQLV